MSAVDDLIQRASAELGKPYVWGAEGPDSFDCSGLMQWVYAQVGVRLPRIADQQQKAVSQVATPRPGDLVFYGRPATHVALYIGQGKMIHAPNRNSTVQIADVYGSPTYGRVSGLGTLTAPIVDAAGDALAGLDGLVDQALGGARTVVLQGALVGLGAVLVALGLWRATSPGRARVRSMI